MEDVFCAFGRGSRGCIGKDLAWMVLEMATIAVSGKAFFLVHKSEFCGEDSGSRYLQIVQGWKFSCKPGGLVGKDALEMQYDELKMSFTARD